MQQTRALQKIITLRKKIRGIQGGQGAGKTIAILIILCDYASGNRDKEIYIASDELSKMRMTVIKDFVKVMRSFGIFDPSRFIGETLYRFPSGSFIKFLGLDKEDVGKGMRSDVMFVNEANKIKFDTYRELTSRAKNVYIDFNPNKKFWFHTQVKPRDDCDFITLTFNDNEFLSNEERSEILRYKRQGYQLDDKGDYVYIENEDSNGNITKSPVIINQYWANMWQVYGLGVVGQVEGRIYTWNPIVKVDYLQIAKTEYFGNDWGKVDPWAVVGVKYHDGSLYVDERNYESENEIESGMNPAQLHQIRALETVQADGSKHDGLVSWKFKQFGVPFNSTVICDTNRPNKIKSLRRSGWEYAVGVGGKLDLINRIAVLSGLNIFYTDTSLNIEAEQETYAYEKDKFGVTLEKPVDQDNHTIDAITYAVQHLFNIGIIKNI